MLILLTLECLSQLLSPIKCRSVAEIDLEVPIRLRTFSVYHLKKIFESRRAKHLNQRINQEEDRIKKEIFERKQSELRRKIIKELLEPRAGQTSIMKDLLSRF